MTRPAAAGVDVRFPLVLVGAGWHCGDVTRNSATLAGGGAAPDRGGLTGRAGGMGSPRVGAEPAPLASTDDDRRYQAAVSKDPRFDGVFLRSHWNQPSPVPLQASVCHSL